MATQGKGAEAQINKNLATARESKYTQSLNPKEIGLYGEGKDELSLKSRLDQWVQDNKDGLPPEVVTAYANNDSDALNTFLKGQHEAAQGPQMNKNAEAIMLLGGLGALAAAGGATGLPLAAAASAGGIPLMFGELKNAGMDAATTAKKIGQGLYDTATANLKGNTLATKKPTVSSRPPDTGQKETMFQTPRKGKAGSPEFITL